METRQIIAGLVLIPLLGFVSSLLIPEKKEKLLARLAFTTVLIQLSATLLLTLIWILDRAPVFHISELELFHSAEYRFAIDFYFDKVTAVYLFTGSFVTLLITRYSAYYLHLEPGYKRFFNTILFFFLGYNFTILAGNFETLFMGWEMLGFSSFLLIAFYRERYLPVRNAVKVFSIYRIGDLGILLAMWASHHLWHENVTFLKLGNDELVHELLQSHSGIGLFISLCLLTAAAAKSAQLPFSSWLPRAMEGPTPSSAIFYGSLSVHLGVFLLLRTFHFWEHQWGVRVLIALTGIVTAVIAVLIARVQPGIKSQIAYASIAQIGIMFVEIALGLENLALLHFVGNAFLRTYQLLVSPSVVSYTIRDQFYSGIRPGKKVRIPVPARLERKVYLLALREWSLDPILNRYLFGLFKRIGKQLNFITPHNVFYLLIPAFAGGILLYHYQTELPAPVLAYLPELLSCIAMILVFKSFSERRSPLLAWGLVLAAHYWIALAVSFNESYTPLHNWLYLSGVSAGGVLGALALRKLKKLEPNHFHLHDYLGHVAEHRSLAIWGLMATLGLMAFPLTPSFIGEDLIFSHIRESQILLAFFNSMTFVIGGIALVRIYARLFLGPHVKHHKSTPLRSA